MKKYVINMIKDYGVLWRMSGQWIKKYWLGYAIFTAVIFGAEMVYLKRMYEL